MDADSWSSAFCLALMRQQEVIAKVIQVMEDEGDPDDEDEEFERLQGELRQQHAVLRLLTPPLLSQTRAPAAAASARTPRSVWMLQRSKDWWERVVLQEFTDEEWLENFRMTRGSFHKLCALMEAELKPQSVTVRAPIPLEMRVAIALHKLATCADYQEVARRFGVHKSTVMKFVHSFCSGMVSTVMSSLIREPTPDEARDIAARFEEKFHLPQVIGCVDSTHIPILPPSDGRDFVNGRGWPSYVLQAVVDDACRFWDISCKMPGSSHDAAVLKESLLYERASLLPKDPKEICGASVGFFLVGGSAYPLTEWLMTDYRASPSVTPQQESFNAVLSAARATVEAAFGRLRSRWRVLAKRSDLHHSFQPKVVAACCALHNFCEAEGEAFDPAWAEPKCPLAQPAPPPCDSATPGGREVRTALTRYLSDHFPPGLG